MKRIAWVLAAGLLAAAALFVLIVVLLPREALKTRVGEQIAAWTGRDVSLRGEPELDFFPQLTVTLSDVEVGGPPGMADAGIVSMDRLEGTIRLLPLIIGRVEIGSFTLVRPQIRLVRDNRGGRNWEFDSGAAALQLAFAGDVPLGEFVIEDGTLVYQNRQEGVTERLDSVHLTLDWTSVRRPLSLSGVGIWRGEQVTFTASADAPFDFMNRKPTPLLARLDSAPISVIFTGAAENPEMPRLSGDLALSTPSLRGFAAWLGSPIGPGSTLGPASISGAAVFREGLLSMENAELTLDGNSASGALEMTAPPNPNVAGTLAFPALDLTPYFAGMATALRSGGDWRDVDVDTDWLHDLSADIRLSAESVRAGGLDFGDTAASVSLRDARLELGLAQAAFNGGSLAGDLVVSDLSDADGAEYEAQLRATSLDLAMAAVPLGLPAGVSGTAWVATDLAGRGRRFGEIAAGLAGTSTIEVRSGALPLFGIAELATPGSGLPSSAASPVTDVTARLSFGEGRAKVDRLNVSAPGFSADASGSIGLLDGALDLSGTVTPLAGVAPRLFAVGGTLAAPLPRALTN